MPYPRFIRRLFANDGAGPKLLGSIIPFGTAAPKAAGTAAVGTSDAAARADHVHPAQTTISGNAASATKWATKRTVDGVQMDGSANITHYGSCSTAAATVEKAVALTGFVLATGARVTVRFTVTNTAASPMLNVNSTGAKAIKYRNAAITAGALAANRVYEFVYDGADWELVGDLDTNTTYAAFTKATASAAGKAGLVPAPAAGKQNALLRGDGTWADIDSIFPADEQETLRKLSIGAPKLHRSTTLPPNHAWPDGSLVLFADWPELKEVYDAGGFAGMLMAYNANATTQAANLGKFRPNAANPTGLYLPLHGGQFFRNWVLGMGQAGAWGRDEIRNIVGKVGLIDLNPNAPTSFSTAPFTTTTVSYGPDTGYNPGQGAICDMDISRSAPTGPQNVPQHIWQPIILYLGRPK